MAQALNRNELQRQMTYVPRNRKEKPKEVANDVVGVEVPATSL